MHHQTYQSFRNTTVRFLDPKNELSGREQILQFRAYVETHIETILRDHPELSEKEFHFIDADHIHEIQTKQTLVRILSEPVPNGGEAEEKVVDSLLDILHSPVYSKIEYTLLRFWNDTVKTFRLYGFDTTGLFKGQLKKCAMPEGLSEQLRDCLRVLSQYFLEQDQPRWYEGIWPLVFFDEKERMREVFRKSENYEDHDIFNAVQSGTRVEKRNATARYLSHIQIDRNFENGLPFYTEKIEAIRKELTRYCETHAIPLTQKITARTINLAMETLREEYDLVIGVLNSGSPVAAIHEIFGRQVRYVEWHRNWKRPPIWRKVGSNMTPIKVNSVSKILVCEHDTHSGTTLQALLPYIEKLNPKTVDICFLEDIHGVNHSHANCFETLRAIMNSTEVPQHRLYDHVIQLGKQLRSLK